MIFFDYDEPKHEFLTDEKMCLKIIYNEVLFAFITLHPDNVKVWDARNGETLSAHRDLSEGELTCCCLDDRERKLFLGDTNGNIISINVRNGARLREFKSHEKGANPNRRIVSDLAYFAHKNTKLLVSSSQSSSIMIHDDSESDPNKSRSNEMAHHKKQVNFLTIKSTTLSEKDKEKEKDKDEDSFNSLDGVLASSSDDGSIILTNLSSYRIEA